MMPRFCLLIAAAAIGALGATARPLAAQAPQHVEVRLNDQHLGQALLYADSQELLLRLSDLLAAIDGSGATRHLRVDGAALVATQTGACSGCRLAVRRAVRISADVRTVEHTAYVPLTDIKRALEGRIVADTTHRVFNIHVGTCNWCILEPRAR